MPRLLGASSTVSSKMNALRSKESAPQAGAHSMRPYWPPASPRMAAQGQGVRLQASGGGWRMLPQLGRCSRLGSIDLLATNRWIVRQALSYLI